jgi:hypothetical protein
MTRNDYLRCVTETGFFHYFVGLLRGDALFYDGQDHSYEIPDHHRHVTWICQNNGNQRWTCRSLVDAWTQYYWNGNYAGNQGVIVSLRDSLQAAYRNNAQELLCVCLEILRWGGVVRGSLGWLREQNEAQTLNTSLETARDILAGEDDGRCEAFGNGLLMNSGMTKIYAFLSDASIIYDGRVGAALGLLSMRYLADRPPNNGLPECLAFCWGPSRGVANRNPSARGFVYKRFTQQPIQHAVWNLRANWLLNEALDTLAQDQQMPRWLQVDGDQRYEQLRRIEAALFMIGYSV